MPSVMRDTDGTENADESPGVTVRVHLLSVSLSAPAYDAGSSADHAFSYGHGCHGKHGLAPIIASVSVFILSSVSPSAPDAAYWRRPPPIMSTAAYRRRTQMSGRVTERRHCPLHVSTNPGHPSPDQETISGQSRSETTCTRCLRRYSSHSARTGWRDISVPGAPADGRRQRCLSRRRQRRSSIRPGRQLGRSRSLLTMALSSLSPSPHPACRLAGPGATGAGCLILTQEFRHDLLADLTPWSSRTAPEQTLVRRDIIAAVTTAVHGAAAPSASHSDLADVVDAHMTALGWTPDGDVTVRR